MLKGRLQSKTGPRTRPFRLRALGEEGRDCLPAAADLGPSLHGALRWGRPKSLEPGGAGVTLPGPQNRSYSDSRRCPEVMAQNDEQKAAEEPFGLCVREMGTAVFSWVQLEDQVPKRRWNLPMAASAFSVFGSSALLDIENEAMLGLLQPRAKASTSWQLNLKALNDRGIVESTPVLRRSERPNCKRQQLPQDLSGQKQLKRCCR